MTLSTTNFQHSILGYPQVQGYVSAPRPSFRSFQVADGPTRWRQDRPTTVLTVNTSWIWTQAQFEHFEGWYYHKINQGLLWFDMLLMTGNGLWRYDCHITEEAYTANYLGGGEMINTSNLGVGTQIFGGAWDVSFNCEYVYDESRNNYPTLPDDGTFIIAGTADAPLPTDLITADTADNPAEDGIIDAEGPEDHPS
jgi:hypothetical protein